MTLTELRTTLALHYAYGYADYDGPGLRVRAAQLVRAFGLPCPDSTPGPAVIAVADFLWKCYVPLVRDVVYNKAPEIRLAYDWKSGETRTALYLLAVALQVDGTLQELAKQVLTAPVFQSLYAPSKPPPELQARWRKLPPDLQAEADASS